MHCLTRWGVRHRNGFGSIEWSLVLCCVSQVGPGVKDLSEGDVVLPTIPLLGTFTQAAVVKAKQVVRVGKLASLENGTAEAISQTPGNYTNTSGSAQTPSCMCVLPVEAL